MPRPDRSPSHLLARNSLYNFLGGVIPAIASLLTVPVIVSHLGEAQYGVFALLSAIIGYFAVLDINVAAGSIKFLSEYQAQGDHDRAGQVVSSGTLIYTLIGILGGSALFLFAHRIVPYFKVDAELVQVTGLALQVGGISFCFGQLQAYLTSVPQALHRYDVSGRFEATFGTLVSFSTLGVVLVGGDLVHIMWVRLILSVLNVFLLAIRIRKLLPDLKLRLPSAGVLKSVTAFSAYAYLSRISSITYQNADKLLIGGMIDMRAVAFYTVPFLLVNRLYGMCFRFGSVLFPFSSALAAENRTDELRETYLVASRYFVYLNACVCIALCLLARELLFYWAGKVFDEKAALVLVLIATAGFADTLTNLPSLVNDGLGRPRNTGAFAILRALFGISLAYWAIRHYGVIGAAYTQLGTACLMSFAFLIYIHKVSIPVSLRAVYLRAYRPTFGIVLGLVIVAALLVDRTPLGLRQFGICGVLLMLVLMGYGWFVILMPPHRVLIANQIRARLW